MDEQDALSSHFEAVRRFVDLGAHAARRVRGERLPVTVVSPEHSEECHSALVERSEAEWRAVIARVHDDADALVAEPLQEIGNRGHAVVRIRHHSDAHYTYLHCGECSLRTRSS